MRRFLVLLSCIALAVSPAYADSLGSATGGSRATQSSLGGCQYQSSPATLSNNQQSGLNCDNSGNLKTTLSGTVITTTQDPWTAVAGTQTALSIASATAPTVPATATILVIQAQGTNNASGVCAYWRDDGTSPTSSAGQQLSAGQTLTYNVTSAPIKLIAASGATCTATISYFKAT